ncbi:MAG: nucleoside diphosphate kinase regulator [Desulfobacterales bacterium]
MSERKPSIKVSSLDFERIEALLDSLPPNSFPEADLLAAELDRAQKLDPQKMPADVVTMNSKVRFAVEPSGKEYELTLVYPKAIDGAAGKISILAPVGSALLGLSVGQEIEWPAPGGNIVRVRIIDILYQPERAGDFHL